MPYQQQIVDPFGGVKEGINALATVAQIGQRDRALDQTQQRVDMEQGKYDQEQALLPFKYQQAKMEAGLQFLPGMNQQSYAGFYKWATETPIDPKTGLGTIPRELLPAPDEVSAMKPEDFETNKRRWFMSGKQLAEMNVADYKAKLEEGLNKQKAGYAKEEIDARGRIYKENDQRTLDAIGQRRDLEGVQHQNALELEKQRFEREKLAQGGGGGRRDPRMMDIMNRAQQLTDAKRKVTSDTLPGQKPNTQVLGEIDTEMQSLSQRYEQLGGDPRDLLQGVAPAPTSGAVKTYNPTTRKFE